MVTTTPEEHEAARERYSSQLTDPTEDAARRAHQRAGDGDHGVFGLGAPTEPDDSPRPLGGRLFASLAETAERCRQTMGDLFIREFSAATAHADAKEAALDTFGYGKPTLTYNGRFLVYFNRHVDAPRVWCIACPDRGWEIAATSVDLRVGVTTRYDSTPPRGAHDGPPSAWFEGHGFVQVDESGRAVITQSKEQEQ